MTESPKQKFRALDRKIAEYANNNGMTFQRVCKSVAQMLICGVFSKDKAPASYRCTLSRAALQWNCVSVLWRLTKDIDIGLVVPPNKLLPTLQAALVVGYGDFAFSIIDKREIPHDMQRVEIQIIYCGIGWAKIDVDLSAASTDVTTEVLPVIRLKDFGLGQFDIVCISIEEQIAQKIHGGTEPDGPNYTNPRSRDVFDILVIARQLKLDYGAIKTAAVAIFAARAVHAWPPSPEIRARWHDDLRRLADENAYHATDVATMQREFTEFFVTLLGVQAMPGYEYQFLTIQIHAAKPGEQFPIPVETGDMTYENLQEHAKKGWRIVSALPHPSPPNASLIIIMERVIEVTSS